MSKTVSHATFLGLDVRVIERELTVFTQPSYRSYFHPNHRLLLISVTDERDHLEPGHWLINLVSTIGNQLPPGYCHSDWPSVRIVDYNDVIEDIRLETQVSDGHEVDDVILGMYNLRSNVRHYQHFHIHHGVPPPIPAK